MPVEFAEKLRSQSDLFLFMNPQLVKMPLPMKRHDDPFFPFGRAIINATRDLVCGYIFDLASYLRLGAAGAIALERTISTVVGENVTVLHGPFAGAGFAEISDENAFGVEAVTLADVRDYAAYTQRVDRGAFVVSETLLDAVPVFMPQRLVYPGLPPYRVVRETALYAGSGEDYAAQTRRVLEEMLHDGG